MNPIITSIIDTDLYKFTMQQTVFHQYPFADAVYEFRCRNKNVKLGYLATEVRAEVNAWSKIFLSGEEADYLKTIPFLTPDYIDYLSWYRFDPKLVDIKDINGDLIIKIKGRWLDTILFEVPLLATINELHFRNTTNFENLKQAGNTRLTYKIEMLRAFPRIIISEFGTRRRYSKDWQKHILGELARTSPQVCGTSNILLAKEFGIKAVGTMAHEYISAHLALVDNIRQAQKRAFHVWQQEYDENLGIALTDTFTSKAFFMDFDKTLSKSFAGVRHDSGDPIQFGWDVIAHYKSMGIDPRTKTIVFSDGLDIPKAVEIYLTFTGLIGISFGIGTNLTNDLGVDALNIVIKMLMCNGKDVVKLSDIKGKHVGDEALISRIENDYGLRN